jgi:hypothetical protein
MYVPWSPVQTRFDATVTYVVIVIGLNGKFLRFRRDGVSIPRSFYKAGIEKLVTRWKTVIASNGNYIID